MRLLRFLAGTPLAKQPLPDAYQEIDQYRAARRYRRESAGGYVLREQEAYDNMVKALQKPRRK